MRGRDLPRWRRPASDSRAVSRSPRRWTSTGRARPHRTERPVGVLDPAQESHSISEPLIDPHIHLARAPQTVGAGKNQLEFRPLACNLGKRLQCQRGAVDRAWYRRPAERRRLPSLCARRTRSQELAPSRSGRRQSVFHRCGTYAKLICDVRADGEHAASDPRGAAGQQASAPQLSKTEVPGEPLEREVVDRDHRRHPTPNEPRMPARTADPAGECADGVATRTAPTPPGGLGSGNSAPRRNRPVIADDRTPRPETGASSRCRDPSASGPPTGLTHSGPHRSSAAPSRPRSPPPSPRGFPPPRSSRVSPPGAPRGRRTIHDASS